MVCQANGPLRAYAVEDILAAKIAGHQSRTIAVHTEPSAQVMNDLWAMILLAEENTFSIEIIPEDPFMPCEGVGFWQRDHQAITPEDHCVGHSAFSAADQDRYIDYSAVHICN
jgi:hypothetical protein